MENCVFCKIVSGELPSDKVYEDDEVLAFLDIQPIRQGHTLLIPKTHANDLLSVDEKSLAYLMSSLPNIARSVVLGVEADGFNVGINNGKAAGQLVGHMHIHIIPRKDNDGLQSWGHTSYSSGEAKEIAERIRNVLTDASI
ncbi:MAG: HIT family protein [Patescibacteria group bacterium]|jgi:histidine triad (HIT) family protein